MNVKTFSEYTALLGLASSSSLWSCVVCLSNLEVAVIVSLPTCCLGLMLASLLDVGLSFPCAYADLCVIAGVFEKEGFQSALDLDCADVSFLDETIILDGRTKHIAQCVVEEISGTRTSL